MIISHKYKFIFLKTRKTAGTSIEIALSKICGDKDIITNIRAEDEEIRKELGFRSPQNYFVPYYRYNLNDWRQAIKQKKRKRFYNHICASNVRRWIGEKVWNSYFKFCFERNPWDKAISQYYFFSEVNDVHRTFEEHIADFYPWKLTNFDIYSIDGHVAVDHVAMFENLKQEFSNILKKIGINEDIPLPRAKGNIRKDKRPYQEVYKEKEREYVRTVCKREIELLGYEF
jgi:hypothetical protein